MALSRKVDYPALEREFVTAPEPGVSRRALAVREGISNSTLSDYARSHDWEAKRQRFLDSVDEEFIRISALARGRKLAELAERSVDVLEAMLVRAAQQLNPPENEDGTPSATPLQLAPRDVLDVIRQISVARGQPGDITEERVGHAFAIDPRVLELFGEFAGRALSGRSGDPRQVGATDIRALPGPAERAGDAAKEAAS